MQVKGLINSLTHTHITCTQIVIIYDTYHRSRVHSIYTGNTIGSTLIGTDTILMCALTPLM